MTGALKVKVGGSWVTIPGGGGGLDAEAVRDTIAAALVAGANITITVDDTADTITIASTGGGSTDPEVVRDTMATALVAGSNVTITPDDTANTITIASSGGGTTDPEVVRDTMAGALVAGSNVTITVSDVADTITIAGTVDAEVIRDTIGAALVAGSGINVTVDDTANTITIASTTGGAVSLDPAASDVYSRNTGASGFLFDLMSGALRVYGRSRVTGRATLNGVQKRETLDWYYGDPDPTASAALPTWVHVRCHLTSAQTAPAWVLALDGAEVIQDTSTVTYEFKWIGTGLADEAALAAGSAGTGDNAITALFNANAPTVETGDTTTPAVEFLASASQVGFYQTITAGTTRQVGFWLKTGSSFVATTIMRFRSGASTEAASIGINVNGVLRVFNSGNVQSFFTPNSTLAVSTWYWVELELKQNATANLGTARLRIWNTAGSNIYDSTALTDATGFGTTHDRAYFGVLTSVTSTLMMAKFHIVNVDTATLASIGPIA